MKTLRALLVLLPALLLGGCIDVDKVVKLNPDGSGTITERVIMGKAVIEQMKSMAAAFGGKGDDATKGFNLADEKKAREQATKLGEGVTFVSVKKITNDKGEGAETVYAFKDINKVKIDQNPSSEMPSGPAGGPGPEKQKEEPITFKFTKGSPATLVATMPTPDLSKAKKEKEAAGAGMEEMAAQMMQQMFKDMRMKMSVQVAGTITESNATYKTASEVTLMEMDFNKLLANPEKFKALTKAQPDTVEEMKKLLQGVDGVKVETAPVVTIKFK